MIENLVGRVRLHLWIQPNASKSEVIGPFENSLKIKIKAPPVDGKANKEVIEFLSDLLDVPKKNISILRGDSSRKKCVEIMGLSESEIRARLNLA